ncbi:MAG: ABC transporter ATP-binding protein [Candidatus Nezhaarchaeales archaeon]
MIKAENVWYKYPNGALALRGVNLTIGRGDYVAILGENGAGKTTLVKHFNGLLKPSRGEVLVDGKNTKEFSVAELSRIVGLVFQNADHQLFAESVRAEVLFALRNFGYDVDDAEERVKQVLAMLSLDGYEEDSPFTLSGGERKRLALASVLSYEPKVLVLDEPTIGQDYAQKVKLAELLKRLQSEGRTIVVVTHDVEFVVDHIPKTIVMSEGRVIAVGRTEEVLTNDEVLAKASLLPPIIYTVTRRLFKVSIPEKVTSVAKLKELILKKERCG